MQNVEIFKTLYLKGKSRNFQRFSLWVLGWEKMTHFVEKKSTSELWVKKV